VFINDLIILFDNIKHKLSII